MKNEKRPDAWVVMSKDRGRKSIKNGKVYLNDGDVFEIELFNPLTISVLADIKLNGSSISKNGLVIKPGERIYLDCYIEDKRKFKFSTYNVENTEEVLDAIKQNGLLEVFFYKEEIKQINKQINIPLNYPTYPITPVYPTCPYDGYQYSTDINFTTDYQYFNNISCNTNNVNIETGRIEKGDVSNTEFSYIYDDDDFEWYYSQKTTLQILPESRKPLDSKDIYVINNKNNELVPSNNTILFEADVIEFKSNNIINNKDNIIELIKKLSLLYNDGILTEEEYKNKKTELLSKI